MTAALELSRHPALADTAITVVDRLPFPAADGSSIDGSRIVRADYPDVAYAQLCHEAQTVWRGECPPSHPLAGLGAAGRYSQPGLLLTGGANYVQGAYAAVAADGGCERLHGPADVRRVLGTGGSFGTGGGYVNRRSGWADAEAAMRFLRAATEASGRVAFVTATVAGLLADGPGGSAVVGVRLADGAELRAALTVVAAGAWSPALVPELCDRSVATGQAMAYLRLPPDEWAAVARMPVVFDQSTGAAPPRSPRFSACNDRRAAVLTKKPAGRRVRHRAARARAEDRPPRHRLRAPRPGHRHLGTRHRHHAPRPPPPTPCRGARRAERRRRRAPAAVVGQAAFRPHKDVLVPRHVRHRPAAPPPLFPPSPVSFPSPSLSLPSLACWP